MMTQEERVAQARSTLEGLEGILSPQDLAMRQEHLETAEMLRATAEMTGRRLDVLIDLALGMATEGLERELEHGYTCAYCTGDGISRPRWSHPAGYHRHMRTVHHGLPNEVAGELRWHYHRDCPHDGELEAPARLTAEGEQK